MPEEERTIYLYHANWCGHCKTFIPVWNDIKKRIDQIRKTNKSVSYEEYEADENADVMDKENIVGFPTIKMRFGNKIVEYSGDRSLDAVMDAFLETKIPDKNVATDQDAQNFGQCGGGVRQKKSARLSNSGYKTKYAKYKAKYFKLLSQFPF